MTETKAKILQAASDLFLEGGAAALSVRAISRKAGLSTIGIYSHFNGKQGILDALYIEGFAHVTDAMDVAEYQADPAIMIEQAARRYLQMAERHKAHYKLIFGEGDSSYTPSEEAKQAGRDAFNILVGRTSTALPDGVSQDIRQKFAIDIWALLHGYVSLSDHAVANLVGISDWKDTALQSIRVHVAARLSAFSVTKRNQTA